MNPWQPPGKSRRPSGQLRADQAPDGKGDSGQRLPESRDLYDSGTAAAAGRAADPDPAFHGEFEQRDPGIRGTGPSGFTGSDEQLRQELCRRVADDPRVAEESIEIVVDGQSVVLSGTIRDRRQRDWLLQHAEAAGIADVRDQLRLGPTTAATAKTLGSTVSYLLAFVAFACTGIVAGSDPEPPIGAATAIASTQGSSAPQSQDETPVERRHEGDGASDGLPHSDLT